MNIKRKTIYLLASVCLISLAGCKNLMEVAQSKEYVEPEGVTLMSEAEMRDFLVGNTYQGDSVRHPGSTYIEFIHPDGKINGLWNGEDRYKGNWAISGKVWCYKYKTINGCNTFSRSGDTVFWYRLDGTTKGGKSTVLAGDPNNLAQ